MKQNPWLILIGGCPIPFSGDSDHSWREHPPNRRIGCDSARGSLTFPPPSPHVIPARDQLLDLEGGHAMGPRRGRVHVGPRHRAHLVAFPWGGSRRSLLGDPWGAARCWWETKPVLGFLAKKVCSEKPNSFERGLPWHPF